MKQKPIHIAVTGAAGQIGYALLFRIAQGDMTGKNRRIILQLLDIPSSLAALRGAVMELEDCAFPLLEGIIVTDDPLIAFQDAEAVIMVGARPRSKGMERKDLLKANAEIFKAQGKALNQSVGRNAKILVVGNPANTNALIAMTSAPDLGRENFSAMIRLDHNRALSMLAHKVGAPISNISQLVVWGNHSPTMYADYRFALNNGKPLAFSISDKTWNTEFFIPTVALRGTAIIEARGVSSAASAANAIIDHMHDWILGSEGRWVSMALPSDGSYNIPEGIFFGVPAICEGGLIKRVKNLEINEFAQEKLQNAIDELIGERDSISSLL